MATRKDREKREVRYSDAKQVAEKNQSGFELTSIKLPKGVELYSLKEGLHKLDIVPFFVGKNNPNADEGMVHYERVYFVHKNIGPENKWYTCLAKTFHEPCPICEHIDKMRREGKDKDTIYALSPKKRQLFAVIDISTPSNRENGVQIVEGPYFNGLGELLDVKIEAIDDDSPKKNFFHLEDGMSVYVKVKQESTGESSFMKPVNVEIEPRKKQYDESLLDEVPCLDDCPSYIEYEKLKKIFHQGSQVEDEEPPQPSSSSLSRNGEGKDEDDDNEPKAGDDGDLELLAKNTSKALKIGDIVTYKKLECEITKISSDGKTLTLEDEDGEILKKVLANEVKLVPTKENTPDPDEDEDSEDDSELEPPPKTKAGKKPTPAIVEENDDMDEDDEDLDDDDD